MIDAKVNYINEEYFDINFLNGDIETTENNNTNIYMSIFNNQRANSSEISIVENQGGWWGNLFLDIEIGSKLWLTYQSPTSNQTKNTIKSYLINSLNWLIETNTANKIDVNVTNSNSNSNDKYLIFIKIYNNNNIEKFNISV